MPTLALGVSSYRRDAGKGGETILFNMLMEADPTNEVDGLKRVQRPGLAAVETRGNGACRGCISQLGSDIVGDAYFLNGTALHRIFDPTPVGTIPGTDLVDMALTPPTIAFTTIASMFIVSDGLVYLSDGSSISPVSIPDSREIVSVATLNGYFLLAEKFGSRIYWVNPGETTVDALNFVSAEGNPDYNTAIKRFGDEFWVFGAGGVQPFSATGDADVPFQPVPGRAFSTGTLSRNSIVNIGDTMMWVSQKREVVMWNGGAQPVSSNGIAERLGSVSFDDLTGWVRAWGFTIAGHTCYVLTIPDEGTFVYDLTSKEWSEFGTDGQTGFRGHLGVQVEPERTWIGDDATNQIWRWDTTQSNDEGDALVREVSGLVTILGKPIANASVELRMDTGFAASLTDSDALLFRYSDDDGNTWTDWDSEPVGSTGYYGGLLTIRRQGLIEAPGRIYKFRFTADSPFRLSYGRVGEAVGSRPRAA
jgi:hypothetical protein